jgi:acyl-coenzyme A synthetase/AMP-(fatty) acid ligase
VPALEFKGEWYCWGQLRKVADTLNALLTQSGAHPTAPVVFVPHNRPCAAGALVGILAGGRSVRMVYGFQSATGVARDVDQLDPPLVVASAELFTPELLQVLRARGAAAFAITDMAVTAVAGFERTTNTRSYADEAPEIQILTSGTTGRPKRFGMSHEMIARHAVGANKNYAANEADLSHLPPIFAYYPLGNISGVYGVLPPLLRGHRVSLCERFSVDAWRAYLRMHKPDRASLPPAGFQMVLDANVPPEELACVRCIATGAAPLELSIQRAFEARYNVPVLHSYGATEFAGPVASMTLELHAEWGERKLGSVGRALPGAQLRVVDAISGAPLPAGQEGLLEVITTRIGPDWIRTSDIAVIDEDGFLFLRGRSDGAIMRGGFKLLPETIERALLLHPAVSSAVVVGLADARLGQVPAAVVQLRQGVAEPSERELEQHVREHVYATHVPVAWRFVEDLPLTASMKVDRPAVSNLFGAPQS